MATKSSQAGPSHPTAGNDFRGLPSVSFLLERFQVESIASNHLTAILREVLAGARHDIKQGEEVDREEILDRCKRAIELFASTRLGPAINGTGVILHTNLGRAPVSPMAASVMATAAASYVSLELDPETNQRGGRTDEVSRLMRVLTGAEATLVVNNNAGAVLLALAALAEGREVIVSRGESVEIGGGFRIPDVIAQSGCRLVEVGTTNRTYAADFERATSESTGAILKVHASNFRIEGFVASASTEELAAIASSSGIPLIEDLGSGALLDTARYGRHHEPTVAEAIAAGVSIVTMSGDKLLGGPQAGLIAGKTELVRRIEQHPLARALRVDKVTLAGTSATLRHYLAGNAESEIPIWRMIAAPIARLEERASAVAAALSLDVGPTATSVGGGSLPGETIPSVALAIRDGRPDELATRLRTGNPRVFPFIRDGRIWIDLRTVLPEQDLDLASALAHAIG
jgi:L-seryl-tRNA(Ser) seleniumtransferase